MACVLGLYFSVERLSKHRSLDYTPSTSSATGCCLSGSVNYLLVPRREHIERIHSGPPDLRITLLHLQLRGKKAQYAHTCPLDWRVT